MKTYKRNNFKLTFDKQHTHFFVNENKGTVSCVITAFLLTPYSWVSPVTIGSKDFKATGVAKCHTDDIFDIERGKRIALTKAENKIYKEAASYLKKEQEHLIFIDNAITEFTQKAEYHCSHNEDYMESVSNPEHPRYKKDFTKIKSGVTINVS